MWRFNQLLRTRPLLTKSLTGACLAGTGDIITQTYETKHEFSVDPLRRWLGFCTFGALWTGIINHYWLGYLARRFPKSAGAPSLLAKLFIQQALWNPLVYLPLYFSYFSVFNGRSRQEAVEWVRKDYWDTLKWCWVVWLPINGFIFMVAERYQSILMSLISLAWNSFLSWQGNRRSVVAQFESRHNEIQNLKN